MENAPMSALIMLLTNVNQIFSRSFPSVVSERQPLKFDLLSLRFVGISLLPQEI